MESDRKSPDIDLGDGEHTYGHPRGPIHSHVHTSKYSPLIVPHRSSSNPALYLKKVKPEMLLFSRVINFCSSSFSGKDKRQLIMLKPWLTPGMSGSPLLAAWGQTTQWQIPALLPGAEETPGLPASSSYYEQTHSGNPALTRPKQTITSEGICFNS